MTLQLHRSERADALVQGLGRLLADVPDDPFTPEIVAVPSKGVERWVTQTLSARLGTGHLGSDGICANLLFPSPARLVTEALVAGTGVDPRDDPWSERRLTWALLEVLDACRGEPWCTTLSRHLGVLGGRPEPSRRVAVAQKLAALFASYAAQRPAMLREWAAGRDADGAGGTLAGDLSWQAQLWRRVRAALGTPSPAERLTPACERLVREPEVLDLPARVSLFGPTRLTTEQLAVVRALAAHRDVHLWLPHPSDALWRRVGALAATTVDRRPEAALEGPERSVPRREDPTAGSPRHPLLRSCGRDARELQVRLVATGTTDPATLDEHLPALTGTGRTLLAALQRDVREDRDPGPVELDPRDRSLQVHACHGRQRQVEVLREVVLGLLADDPSLELRDVVVMCPDIEAYAPLIHAAFEDLGEPLERPGTDVPHPGHRLRMRLADRSLRQTNPVLTVVARLLELADARLTASEVLDLAAMPPVRRRFGLDDDALELVGDWVRRSGVRWGLDREARVPYRLDGVAQNTWRAGLDRVLVGAAMDEEGLRTLGPALPLDDVDSGDVDLAGRLAELLDRLAATVAALSGDQPLAAWVDVLVTAVRDLTDVAPREEWQLVEARRQLSDALTAAGPRADRVPLRLGDVRALLADRLRGRPTRAGFRTGHLTICTMVPMRSVPHRVVVLLGLDDGVFPRSTRLDGDDVVGRTPLVGERDPRSEDRQLFLDAMLAAEESLVLLYSGADERTGAVRPPAVPLGELLDVVHRMLPRQEDRSRVVVRHPLQPFDPRAFSAGALGLPGPFSFDRASYAGARSMLAPRRPRPPFLGGPLAEPAPADLVTLPELVEFLEAPVRGFLRQRLDLTLLRELEEQPDAIAVELGPLERWGVGDRLLRSGLTGVGRAEAVRAERLRGDLPPGALGAAVLDPVADEVEVLVGRTSGLRAGPSAAVDVTVDLPGGPRVSGTVPGVRGDRVVRVEYSRLAAKHRVRAWVQLLALASGRPGPSWCAATVGRGPDGPVMSALAGPAPEVALELLETLVRLRAAGLREPLPLAPRSSCAYAEVRRRGGPPRAAEARAAQQWRTSRRDGGAFGEFDDPAHVRVWGEVPLRHLLGLGGPRPAEPYDDEPHRFGQLARQVFGPLLEHEAMH